VIIILIVINVILLMAISGYFINGYWWLFHCKPLVIIDGYFINGYCIMLLLVITCYIATIGDYCIINYC